MNGKHNSESDCMFFQKNYLKNAKKTWRRRDLKGQQLKALGSSRAYSVPAIRVVSRVGLFGRASFGLKFVKMFRTCIQNFFITFRVTTFFFGEVHLLCSRR